MYSHCRPHNRRLASYCLDRTRSSSTGTRSRLSRRIRQDRRRVRSPRPRARRAFLSRAMRSRGHALGWGASSGGLAPARLEARALEHPPRAGQPPRLIVAEARRVRTISEKCSWVGSSYGLLRTPIRHTSTASSDFICTAYLKQRFVRRAQVVQRKRTSTTITRPRRVSCPI